MADQLTRDEIVARYGPGYRLPDDIEGLVIVFGHETQEAAEAFAAGNSDIWGHPSRAELREGVGWVDVVDLRPAIARVQAEFREGEAPHA